MALESAEFPVTIELQDLLGLGEVGLEEGPLVRVVEGDAMRVVIVLVGATGAVGGFLDGLVGGVLNF